MSSSTDSSNDSGSGRQAGRDAALGVTQDPRGEYQFGGGYSASTRTAPSTSTFFSDASDETRDEVESLMATYSKGGDINYRGSPIIGGVQITESDRGNQSYVFMVSEGGESRNRQVRRDSPEGRALEQALIAQRDAKQAEVRLNEIRQQETTRRQQETARQAEQERAAEAARLKQADEDKRRADEQARAQREAEARQAEERRKAAEAERQKELDEIAKRNAAENADLMPKGDPFTDPQKASGVRTDARSLENYKERETEALRRASSTSGDQSFVMGGRDSQEVTDAQGNPVLTRQGVERQAAFQQEELERLVSMRQGGEGDPEQGKRDLARQIIEEKLEAGVLPGALGAIQRINLENQLKNLEKGGTPTFRIGPGGEFTTSGVLQPGEEGTGISPNITSDLENMANREEEDRDAPTIIQVDDEPEAEDIQSGLIATGTARRKRGTRGKRPGAGGTLLEGGGILYE